MLLKLIQGIIDGLAEVLSAAVNVLPGSPFNGLNALAMDSKWFRYLAYIVPVRQIVALLEAWLVAIAVYYLYQIVLRWVKAVGN